jgi:hypothetical protein
VCWQQHECLHVVDALGPMWDGPAPAVIGRGAVCAFGLPCHAVTILMISWGVTRAWLPKLSCSDTHDRSDMHIWCPDFVSRQLSVSFRAGDQR